MNLHIQRTLVGAPMYFMASTLVHRGLTLYLLTQKPRYSVSVHLRNNFSAFTFNSSSMNICKSFSIAFRWSANPCLVITSILYMYAHTISNPSKSSDVFSWKISGILQNPIGSFWYLYFPHGSTIVQTCLSPGDNFM